MVDVLRQRVALQVHARMPHEQARPVRGQDVRHGAGHLHAADHVLRLQAGLGITMRDPALDQQLARYGVYATQVDPPVDEGAPPGRGVRDGLLGTLRARAHQYVAVNRPDGLQLTVRDDLSRLGGHAEPPRQRAVLGTQAVDPSVGGPEVHQAPVDGGRGVHAPPGRVTPERRSILRLQGVQRVGLSLRDVEPPVRHDDGGQGSRQRLGPVRGQPARQGRRSGPAARRVVSVGRPVCRLRIADCGLRIPELAVRGALLQASRLRREGCCTLGAEGVEAAQLGRDVARAGVRRRVEQPVGGQYAVLAPSADPVVGDDAVGADVEELHAGP